MGLFNQIPVRHRKLLKITHNAALAKLLTNHFKHNTHNPCLVEVYDLIK